MREDVDHVAERIAHIEPPHAPRLVGQRVDDLQAKRLGARVHRIHVVHLDGQRRHRRA
jgi:hypothetical protein